MGISDGGSPQLSPAHTNRLLMSWAPWVKRGGCWARGDSCENLLSTAWKSENRSILCAWGKTSGCLHCSCRRALHSALAAKKTSYCKRAPREQGGIYLNLKMIHYHVCLRRKSTKLRTGRRHHIHEAEEEKQDGTQRELTLAIQLNSYLSSKVGTAVFSCACWPLQDNLRWEFLSCSVAFFTFGEGVLVKFLFWGKIYEHRMNRLNHF